MSRTLTLFAIAAGMMLAVTACQDGPAPEAAPPAVTMPGTASPAAEDRVAKNLAAFDFSFFTNQKWDELAKSHATDVVVHWPDGRTTNGLTKHIEDLKRMFAFAPDTRVTAYPASFGSGEWTSVMGVMEGTFSEPLVLPAQKPFPPSGNVFKVMMNIVGRWNAEGQMVEEYFFWDNVALMKQLPR